MKPTRIIAGEPSWRLATREAELFLTRRGGHLGPATFRVGHRRIQPFNVAPWHAEKIAGLPPVLSVLRGDFFCLPFGGNETAFRGERHPPHGEAANASWQCLALEPGHAHLRLATTIRRGTVDKHVWLRPGHHAIYQQHVIRGMRGPMNLGHHAMLRFPDAERSGLISTSGFAWGQVAPRTFEAPVARGYQSLAIGAKFRSLAKVPAAAGGLADLSAYPARRGFEDLVMLVGRPGAKLAWTAVSFPSEGYVWFALKDPRVLAHTVLWHSNGGRHYPPWNGRHVNVLGLEEVTSYFHYGLAESARRNPVSAAGGATVVMLSPSRPLVVNYIMAVAPIPRGFDRVRSLTPSADRRRVRLVAHSGRAIEATLDVNFLHSAASC